ncbi:uncharacterized protein LOC135470679 [Liolophura sinensis]|uniref:uncharacterized protein LOC135470679 n=1 Tax=Liolophura sinensis TaxID=3198878 RepID=UPI0031589195
MPRVTRTNPRRKKKSVTPGRGSNPIDTALHALYYNPESPAAYSGVQPLLKAARQQGLKVSRTHVSAWLAQQDTYTLHRPARRHYPRNRVVVGGIDSQWQADLVDMTAFAKENDNNRYLLTCIDVLSKYAWVMPLRTKTGARLIEAFQQIFKTGRRPLCLQTDEGKEFLNRPFQAFLKDKGVFFFHTFNETKASVVELFHRSQHSAIPGRLTGAGSRLQSSLPPKHTTSPYRRHPQNQKEVRQVLYGPLTAKRSVHRYRAGNLVRISKVKGKFEKSYLPNWSTEMFRIVRSHARQPAVYTLEDLNGDQLLGTFYETELQPLTAAVDKFYQVEKILKRELRRGKLYYWVKWVGYPPSFKSWVPATDVKRI